MAAEEAAAPVPPASPFAQVQENIRNLSQRQKLAAGAALAIGIALIVGVLLWSRQPDYSVLFSNLAEKDGGAVVASLQQQNIPYRFSENGNAILVPATQVHDLRLRLAAQGIPKGGLVGFELMETQKLGLSQFHEQVNYQRALEGELSRTISSIASVAGARVHLAIPKQTAFLRDEQKPTASVMVNLHTGRSLDQAQIAGIVHLISSSVPNLSNDNVSVIDQDGSLLTKKPDPLRSALDATQIKYTRELEEGYIQRINAILTPLFGKGNFRAQVSADVDFNQTEQTAETYRPNPSPEQAIRSQQSNESQTRDQGPQGVPGALSNQPPVPATAPITTPAVPGTTGADGRQYRLNFGATGGDLILPMIIGGLLSSITFGIYLPWFICNLRKLVMDKLTIQSVSPQSSEQIGRFEFVGTGGGLIGTFLLGMILTGITFGIYMPWFQVNLQKFYLRNTGIHVGSRSYRGDFTGTGGELLWLMLSGVLIPLTFGMYVFWLVVKQQRFSLGNTKFHAA